MLSSSSVERVTRDMIKSRIRSVDYRKEGRTTTVCAITLDNEFVIHGESSCCDPDKYNSLVGQEVSYEKAFHKLWEFFGFMQLEKHMLLAQRKAKEKQRA